MTRSANERKQSNRNVQSKRVYERIVVASASSAVFKREKSTHNCFLLSALCSLLSTFCPLLSVRRREITVIMHKAASIKLCIFFNYFYLLLNYLTFYPFYSTIIVIVVETGNIERILCELCVSENQEA